MCIAIFIQQINKETYLVCINRLVYETTCLICILIELSIYELLV